MTCSQDSNVTMNAHQGVAGEYQGPPILTKAEPTPLFSVPAKDVTCLRPVVALMFLGLPSPHSNSHALTLQVTNSTSLYS